MRQPRRSTHKRRRHTAGLADLHLGSRGPIAIVVNLLDNKDRVALAAASSQCMAAVIEGYSGTCKWTASSVETGRAVAQRLREHGSAASESLVSRRFDRYWEMWYRADAAPSASAILRVARHLEWVDLCPMFGDLQLEDPHGGSREHSSPPPITAESTALRSIDIWCQKADWLATDWLPLPARQNVKEVSAKASGLRRLPPGMASLEVVDVSECEQLEGQLLPKSSASKVKVFKASSSNLKSVPAHMSSLTKLDVVSCQSLSRDWLPASSRAKLTSLDIRSTNVQQLPPGLVSLQELDVGSSICGELEWLPESSARSVRKLSVCSDSITSVPAKMESLRTLYLEVRRLDSDWLPPSSMKQLEDLRITCGSTYRVPAGLDALVRFSLGWDIFLSARRDTLAAFHPGSSMPRIVELDVSCSEIPRLPSGMTALRYLDVSDCKHLEDDWFGAGSGAALTVLHARGSNLTRVPAGLTALRELDVLGCVHLEDDWLGVGSGGALTVLRAVASNLTRVPAGLTALRELDVSDCKHLEDDWLGVGSGAALTELHACGSNLTRVPAGLKALEDLAVSECKLGANWLPTSSRGALRRLDASGTLLKRVPPGLKSLQTLRLKSCQELQEGFVPASSGRELLHLSVAGIVRPPRISNTPKLEMLCVAQCKIAAGFIDGPSSRNVTRLDIRRTKRPPRLPSEMRSLEQIWAASTFKSDGEARRWLKQLPTKEEIDVWDLPFGESIKYIMSNRYCKGKEISCIFSCKNQHPVDTRDWFCDDGRYNV